MTSYTRKEHVVRAALESIAYQIRDVLEMMRLDSGVSPGMLCVDGGPTRNEFLMQFTADITGLELIVAEVAETSARGAAMAALLGLGAVDSLTDLTKLRGNMRTYRPQMDAAKVEQLYSGWQQAVQRVL
jgi:glycerol kinase